MIDWSPGWGAESFSQGRAWEDAGVAAPEDPEVQVSALAINVTVPAALQWIDERRGEAFRLTTLNVRMLPDGTLAAKAYGQPVAGGRGGYTSFRVPDSPALTALIEAAATRAGEMWTRHRGTGS